MNEPATASTRYRSPGRPGIEQSDVDRAADELLRSGQRPSVEKIRARVGGSPSTIGRLLDVWWARLASRIDAGPDALARLPEPLAHAAEALFIRALDAARVRAEHEQQGTREALTQDQQLLEARRHTLSLREQELERRIAERDELVEVLKENVRYERGERRKLELVCDDLQARLQTLEQKTRRRTRPARVVSPRRPPRARAARSPRKRPRPRTSGTRPTRR